MKTVWISVEDQLPDYEVPVYLKCKTNGINVGFRNSTSITGEEYLILKKSTAGDELGKTTHWAKLEMPDA